MFELLQSLLHIDVTLLAWSQAWGNSIYLILFLIIFVETGIIIMPFLPGDSLLFAIGALAAKPDFIDIKIIIPLLIFAATIGDSTNYFIGRKFGRNLFDQDRFFLKKRYLINTENFYEKKGIWAISLSRFFPIIRTFSPFFAGLSLISYRKFVFLSFIGSVGWVFIFTLAGYFFGQVEIIQKNFTLLVLAIILVSMLPIAFNVLKSIKEIKTSKTDT